MKTNNGGKLFLNKTTVAALSRESMKKIAAGVLEGCEGSIEELVSGDDAFLSIATCTIENGSHCKRCDSCCVGTRCSK